MKVSRGVPATEMFVLIQYNREQISEGTVFAWSISLSLRLLPSGCSLDSKIGGDDVKWNLLGNKFLINNNNSKRLLQNFKWWYGQKIVSFTKEIFFSTNLFSYRFLIRVLLVAVKVFSCLIKYVKNVQLLYVQQKIYEKWLDANDVL